MSIAFGTPPRQAHVKGAAPDKAEPAKAPEKEPAKKKTGTKTQKG